MTGQNLENISQIVLWYENTFRVECKYVELEFDKCPLDLCLGEFENTRNMNTSHAF